MAQYGRRIWNLQGSDDDVAHKAIAQTESFFKSLGVATRFSDYGLNAQEVAFKVTEYFVVRGMNGFGEHQSIGVEQVEQILIARS